MPKMARELKPPSKTLTSNRKHQKSPTKLKQASIVGFFLSKLSGAASHKNTTQNSAQEETKNDWDHADIDNRVFLSRTVNLPIHRNRHVEHGLPDCETDQPQKKRLTGGKQQRTESTADTLFSGSIPVKKRRTQRTVSRVVIAINSIENATDRSGHGQECMPAGVVHEDVSEVDFAVGMEKRQSDCATGINSRSGEAELVDRAGDEEDAGPGGCTRQELLATNNKARDLVDMEEVGADNKRTKFHDEKAMPVADEREQSAGTMDSSEEGGDDGKTISTDASREQGTLELTAFGVGKSQERTVVKEAKASIGECHLNAGKTTTEIDSTGLGTRTRPAAERRKAVTAASNLPPVTAPEVTEYELQRARNIAKNLEFLTSLGIEMGPKKFSADPKSRPHSMRPCPTKCDRTAKFSQERTPRETAGLRRSARVHGSRGEDGAETGKALTQREPEVDLEAEVLSYDDSSVVKYLCGPMGEEERGIGRSEGWEPGPVTGFRPLDWCLYDPALTRVYTIDVTVTRQGRGLLGAGGHGGRISIFAIDGNDPNGGSVVKREDGDGSRGPLIGWKASSSWISHVQFLSQQLQEDAVLFLTSSNDRSLVLWDINKQQQLSASKIGRGAAGRDPAPRVVAELDSAHSGGIFGMHERNLRAATASKDRSLGISRIAPSAIHHERTISGHHSGGVRGVRFRDDDVLADCGADATVCVLDLRASEPCVLSMDGMHASAANVVEWHPSDGNLLLSASHDPCILIHDIRSPGLPLHSLFGHMRTQRSRNIYRPVFVGGGAFVASPGEGSQQISLYSTVTGRATSRGHIGYDATMMSASNQWAVGVDLWVAGSKSISPFCNSTCDNGS